MSLSLASAAATYALGGWPVFPCRTRGKEPAVAGGFKAATTDHHQVKKWWEEMPEGNVGLALSEDLMVLDLDSDDALAHLQSRGLELPATLVVKTARGWHHYFNTAGETVRQTIGEIGPGIDTRCAGKGYVLVPPSIHPSGKEYSIESGGFTRDEIAVAPAWLLSLFAKRPQRGLDVGAALEGFPEGQRDNLLFRFACRLRHDDVPRELAEKQILEAASKCEPPFPSNQALAKIESAYSRYEPGFGPTPIPIGPGGNESESQRTWAGSPLDALHALEPDDPQRAETAAAVLREFAENLEGRDQLDRETARESAIAALKGKLSSPARIVDAALRSERMEVGSPGQGTALAGLSDTEPWPVEVNGSDLLGELKRAFERYVMLPAGASVALSLWVVFSHTIDAFPIAPVLALISPQLRCGKTTLLGILRRLVARPLATSNVTVAALFRVVEKYSPTLLIDEGDTFLRSSDDLRGLINSGHTRDTAFVLRTAGDDHEPRSFSTWGAKAIAQIGRLPETIRDRSVTVPMQRKTAAEPVDKLRGRGAAELAELQQKCARWTIDNLAALRECEPLAPHELHDRAADNWRPLLAIAEVAEGDWSIQARQAALILSCGEAADSESVGVQLLSDIQKAFDEKKEDRFFTDDLLAYLHSLEDRPWPEWGRTRKPMTAVALARQLKPFGIQPKQIRIAIDSKKGYSRPWFEDAFLRYLPTDPKHPKHSNEHQLPEGNGTRNAGPPCFGTDPDGPPIETGGVSDVSTEQEEWSEV
jgi:putative DNA primase/helicase